MPTSVNNLDEDVYDFFMAGCEENVALLAFGKYYQTKRKHLEDLAAFAKSEVTNQFKEQCKASALHTFELYERQEAERAEAAIRETLN